MPAVAPIRADVHFARCSGYDSAGMCGIVGVFAYRGEGLADRAAVDRVRDAMVPRGPDGAGTWFGPNDRLALAHRRLAIIDLNERAAQPMISSDGLKVVAFNGEIYNYRALRASLEARGHAFRTESDTEVLLELYAAHGESMVSKLRGMYAFALWDDRRGGLFLARDPYGIKPLYYADDGCTVRIASQVKALLADAAVSRTLDPAGLVGFLMFGSVQEPSTCFSAIRALPAGHSAWIDENGMRTRRFASIPETLLEAESNVEEAAEARERFHDALLDSVRHHLVADVPVGVFLSSGIDSSTLVGLMRDAGYEDIRTVTIAFAPQLGLGWDEAPLARRIAESYQTTHATTTISPSDFFAAVPSILHAMDQPSIDGMNTWLVSRAAQDAGLKVAMSGLGADELVGGYPSFTDIPRWVRLMRVPSQVPLLADVFRRMMARIVPHLPVSAKASGLVTYGGTHAGSYFLRRGVFMPWELTNLLPQDVVEAGLSALDPVNHVAQEATPMPHAPYARVAAMEAALYLRNQLLRDADWAGMASSLEIRVPYVDLELLRAVAPFIVGTPRLSKQLLAEMPSRAPLKSVMDRPKTGFALPIASWLEDPRSGLDMWRRIPALASQHCHWSRRLAYVLLDLVRTGQA